MLALCFMFPGYIPVPAAVVLPPKPGLLAGVNCFVNIQNAQDLSVAYICSNALEISLFRV